MVVKNEGKFSAEKQKKMFSYGSANNAVEERDDLIFPVRKQSAINKSKKSLTGKFLSLILVACYWFSTVWFNGIAQVQGDHRWAFGHLGITENYFKVKIGGNEKKVAPWNVWSKGPKPFPGTNGRKPHKEEVLDVRLYDLGHTVLPDLGDIDRFGSLAHLLNPDTLLYYLMLPLTLLFLLLAPGLNRWLIFYRSALCGPLLFFVEVCVSF
jgi:hypothetical protein